MMRSGTRRTSASCPCLSCIIEALRPYCSPPEQKKLPVDIKRQLAELSEPVPKKMPKNGMAELSEPVPKKMPKHGMAELSEPVPKKMPKHGRPK